MAKKSINNYMVIEANNRKIQDFGKALDNKKIMNQCNCPHCINGAGLMVKPVGTETVGGSRFSLMECAICGKKIAMGRVTLDQVKDACKILDSAIDHAKIMDTHFGEDEKAMLILSNTQQGLYVLLRLYEQHWKRFNGDNKEKKERRDNSSSQWAGASAHPRASGWSK